MQIHCPHCQNPIELVDEQAGDILCTACGSTFKQQAEPTARLVESHERPAVADPYAKTTTYVAVEGVEASTCDDRGSVPGQTPSFHEHDPVRRAAADRTTFGVGSTGPVLGDYELLDKLGAGGMGVVYRARQRTANRIVALKVIRPERLDELVPERRAEAIDRFRTEAQAAARLEHDHIVTVYEVGEADGQHFYSMRYVEGRSLAEIVRDGPLENRRAAEYMEPIARAVHYAHERGILHRDIKPRNILVEEGRVSRVEGPEPESKRLSRADSGSRRSILSPRPYVTDFGLAKWLEEGSQGVTRTGQIMGTPEYMSPEQAQDSARVTVASDVYSLGATLYDLVTGRPPFQAASSVETLRQVIESEPVAPRQLNPAIDRDLETITLKCLAKETARRYSSAAAFADDLRRYSNGEPIQARPISTAERLVRWCRRKPGMARLTAAVLVLLLAIVSGSIAAALLLAHKERAADSARERADRNASAARHQQEQAAANFQLAKQAVEDYLNRVTQDPDLKMRGDFHLLRKKLLQAAVPFYEKFVQQEASDDRLEAERGRAYGRLADLRNEMGEKPEAQADYEETAAIFARLAGNFPSVPEYRQELARSRNSLGLVLSDLGQHAEALAAHDLALAIRQKLADDCASVAEYRQELASSHNNRGAVLRGLERHEEALAAFNQGLAIRAKLAAEFPSVAEYRQDLAVSYNNVGVLHHELGRREQALAAYDQALAIQEELVADFPTVLEYRQELAGSYNNRGSLLRELGRRDDALAAYAQAIDVKKKLAADFPTVPQYRRELAMSHNNQGNLLRTLERREEALAAYEQSLALRDNLASEFRTVPEYRAELARSHNARGLVLSELGRGQESLAAYQQSILIQEKLVVDFPDVPDYSLDLGGSFGNLGLLITDRGEPEAALEFYAKAIDTLEAVLQKESRLASARQYLRNSHWGRARALTLLGRHADAIKDWQRALELDDGSMRASLRLLRAGALVHAGDHAEAVAEAQRVTEAEDVPADMLYDAACVCAQASAAAQKDAKLQEKTANSKTSEALAAEYAARAVELLRHAVAAGYKDLDQMQKDTDLDAIRDHPGYMELIGKSGK